MKEEFLKIQTCVLKVNIHCDGCKQKVKKLLQKIEGVYTVSIDAEQQKVTVSGNVDSAALIKKLVRAGKHAELWSQTSNQNKKPQQAQCIKDDKSTKNQKQDFMKGLKAFKNQHNFPSFSSEDDDDFEDEDDIDEEEDLRFLREKASHLGLLRQANGPNNANKAVAAAAAVAANTKAGNGGGNRNVGKKGGGNPNQNAGLKNAGGPPGQKNINVAGNSKMNSVAHLGGMGNPNGGEIKKGNEINGMGLGFHPGHGAGAVGLGGNGLGGLQAFQALQAQPNNFQGSGFPATGFGGGLQQPSPMMMNMQGYQHHPSPMGMNMNMQSRPNIMHENRYMQPQMMYNRSPVVHPYTGYYHHNPQPNYQSENADYGTHMFSDENTSSCAIM
ncbi:heavy metal-associated isoprenylated plant protein 37-like [Magnolia sinica]|uniref:heavy metal-associated isoprenylated plant protein 37-like n=1 Tax=Magnolia sinica TaxID=86752 RepID=UPI0026599F59|nr:heavy metal-associated isoprenylated plant protein 37-like [Magnolia sinica]XP_058087914.1 heavy metal-associated isoprenylated plant protein 37-like [Magnolia sinica]